MLRTFFLGSFCTIFLPATGDTENIQGQKMPHVDFFVEKLNVVRYAL